jgi:hypothetical protein
MIDLIALVIGIHSMGSTYLLYRILKEIKKIVSDNERIAYLIELNTLEVKQK